MRGYKAIYVLLIGCKYTAKSTKVLLGNFGNVLSMKSSSPSFFVSTELTTFVNEP